MSRITETPCFVFKHIKTSPNINVKEISILMHIDQEELTKDKVGRHLLEVCAREEECYLRGIVEGRRQEKERIKEKLKNWGTSGKSLCTFIEEIIEESPEWLQTMKELNDNPSPNQ